VPSENIQFRAVPPLDVELHSRRRGGISAAVVAQNSVTRYFTLLAAELREVTLTRGQALLLCSVLNGTWIENTFWARTPREMLIAELEDSQPDGYAERTEVDLASFLDQVRGWTRAQALAVVDAVERFWTISEVEDTDQALAQVGLLRGPRSISVVG
jgi:hypothetical protein